MAGFEILKTKKIKPALSQTVEPLDKFETMAVDKFFIKFQQHKSIMIASVDSHGKRIVDGDKHFTNLKIAGIKKILCFNLGKISLNEYYLYRLLLNVHQARLNYLEIAVVVDNLVKESNLKPSTISNKTGIPQIDVERYSTLLDFDWDEFNKRQINQQINPFD